MSKWETFHKENFDTQSIPLAIEKANPGPSAIVADWQRESSTKQRDKIYINARPLSEFKEEYNNFMDIKDLQKFFKQEILKDMNVSDNKKDPIINYLTNNLHQGGHLFPVTSAFAEFAFKANIGVVSQDRDSVINITSTKNGFKVAEFTKFKSLDYVNDEYIRKKGSPTVLPQKGFFKKTPDYVVKVQGTIDLDFSNELFLKTGKPQINVDSTAKISFGNDIIKKALDTRSWLQVIKDFFKTYSVFVLTPSPASKKPASFLPLDDPAAPDPKLEKQDEQDQDQEDKPFSP